jgi:hypothetical protein
MKRYLLFTWLKYYPGIATEQAIASYDTPEEAKAAGYAHGAQGCADGFAILDRQEGAWL